MKHLLILLLLPLFSFSQINEESPEENVDSVTFNQEGHNTVSKSTYENIKIKGVRLETLQLFQGEVAAMEDLMGMSFSVKIPDPEVRTFYNNSIKLAYGDAFDNWVLGYIEITNSVVPLEILGKTVKIGDDISKLGLGTNLKSLPIDGGKRSAVFTTPYDSSYVGIRFDPLTNKITEIYYVSPT